MRRIVVLVIVLLALIAAYSWRDNSQDSCPLPNEINGFTLVSKDDSRKPPPALSGIDSISLIYSKGSANISLWIAFDTRTGNAYSPTTLERIIEDERLRGGSAEYCTIGGVEGVCAADRTSPDACYSSYAYFSFVENKHLKRIGKVMNAVDCESLPKEFNELAPFITASQKCFITT